MLQRNDAETPASWEDEPDDAVASHSAAGCPEQGCKKLPVVMQVVTGCPELRVLSLSRCPLVSDTDGSLPEQALYQHKLESSWREWRGRGRCVLLEELDLSAWTCRGGVLTDVRTCRDFPSEKSVLGGRAARLVRCVLLEELDLSFCTLLTDASGP
ncbi:hypothetical protein T484DRAFT_1814172 [Baffinella frigidus]|nr:hypothetical protein T484DRAFT_1814172 [Cryptophyta sp. CCMP2293]